VRFASARYSVPTRLIGTAVRVVQDGCRLMLVEPATGQVVATTNWLRLARPGSWTSTTAVPRAPQRGPLRGRIEAVTYESRGP